MSGVVNIYTLSPFEYQGTKIAVTGGNYGLFQARATHYQKISNQLALSFGGYFNRWDGFLKNVYKGTRADNEWSAGGRFRLGWKITPEFTAEYNANFDYVKQSAFPYGKYDATTKKTADPNFNDSSSYERTMFSSGTIPLIAETMIFFSRLFLSFFKCCFRKGDGVAKISMSEVATT